VRREVVPLTRAGRPRSATPTGCHRRYEGGEASTSGKLVCRWTLFEQTDANVVRSAAARSALDAVFAPRSLLQGRGYAWRAESDDHIGASTENPPEHVEVHLRIAPDGRLLSIVAQRWGEITKGSFVYLPFGGDMQEERRFGGLMIPSPVTAGWNYGTANYKPFFKATITTAIPA
jgi:hypothetical protein